MTAVSFSVTQVEEGRPLYCRRSSESDYKYDLVIPYMVDQLLKRSP